MEMGVKKSSALCGAVNIWDVSKAVREDDIGNMRLHAGNLMKQAPAVFLHGQSRLQKINYSCKTRHFVTKHLSSQNGSSNMALTLI